MNKIYVQIIITLALVYSILIYLRFINYISYEFLLASFYSGALNLFNTTAAILLFNSAVKKNNKGFLILNFGGMLVRLLGLLLIIFIFFRFISIDKYGFIILFFVFYFVFLIFEINHFVIRTTGKKRNTDYVK